MLSLTSLHSAMDVDLL